jgi:hypothetical protein
MTQCILSSILTDHHQLSRYSLELFYNDCLNKDELLNEFLITREENNIHRRQIHRKNYYHDPYAPLTKPGNLYFDLDSSLYIPSLRKLNEKFRLSPFVQTVPEEEFDIISQEKPRKLIAQESIMSN